MSLSAVPFAPLGDGKLDTEFILDSALFKALQGGNPMPPASTGETAEASMHDTEPARSSETAHNTERTDEDMEIDGEGSTAHASMDVDTGTGMRIT